MRESVDKFFMNLFKLDSGVINTDNVPNLTPYCRKFEYTKERKEHNISNNAMYKAAIKYIADIESELRDCIRS